MIPQWVEGNFRNIGVSSNAKFRLWMVFFLIYIYISWEYHHSVFIIYSHWTMKAIYPINSVINHHRKMLTFETFTISAK